MNKKQALDLINRLSLYMTSDYGIKSYAKAIIDDLYNQIKFNLIKE